MVGVDVALVAAGGGPEVRTTVTASRLPLSRKARGGNQGLALDESQVWPVVTMSSRAR